MSEHLPEDPKNWPQDPFRLLGVELPTTEMDLKRAYTRLIGRFKPEHFPEQFRLVREAYETALERAKWFSHFTPEPTTTPDEPESELAAPRAVVRQPEEDAWALAASGKRVEAYSHLVELNHGRPENADIALRLYWLLAVQPTLDSDRTRHHWLAAALTRSRLSGPAVELYRRELEANPESSLVGPYLRVLEPDSSRTNLLGVARLRLAAAGVSRMWKALDIDLAALVRRSGELDESAWLGYLVGAMGFLGFEYPAPTYNRCRGLIAGLRHLELRETWAFDQMDEQEAMARALGEANALPIAVLEVVRDAWVAPPGAWRRAMTRAAAWATEHPLMALKEFDAGVRISACQPVLATFQRLLDEIPRPGEPAYPSSLIRGLVREFLTREERIDYVRMRAPLLRLLLAEMIDPNELMQACIEDTSITALRLVEHMRNDAVLRLTWLTATA
jgi:hypothetical protein